MKSNQMEPRLNKTYMKNDKYSLQETKALFEKMVGDYLESNPYTIKNNKTSELEIRFGSNPKLSKPVSKIDYDNVVKQLLSCGFKPELESGIQILRINNEYRDNNGITKISNIRAEIVGTDLIQEYCRTNDLKKLVDMPSTVMNKLKFTKKTYAVDNKNVTLKPVDMPEFNFRVSYQMEEEFNMNASISREILSNWKDTKKMFRCMNRVRFIHPDYPIHADLSIVKMSTKSNKIPIPRYTIQEANVFNNVEQYEVELEVDNSRIGVGTPYNNSVALLDVIRKCIRIVLSGLQSSRFPISYTERDQILEKYMKLIHGDEYQPKGRIRNSNFIGPSSCTLQIENIIDLNENTKLPNIRNNYTVTDKADGERKLLYISDDGKIYMIDTNMNVIFTGTKTIEDKIFNTLLDGEHIKYDKNQKYINVYAAFDIYYKKQMSLRELGFHSTNNVIENVVDGKNETRYRLNELNEVINSIHSLPFVKNDKTNTEFRIQIKNFYMSDDNTSIFEGCSKILSKMNDGNYEYNTDGLIFTPSDMGVGGNSVGHASELKKTTWKHSFKWKPAEFNTIDFLVSIKKDKTGKDEIHNVFQDGRNLQGVTDVLQYKTLILFCGFNSKEHGYLNPCQDVIDDVYHTDGKSLDNERDYTPQPFQPTNPYDDVYHTDGKSLDNERDYTPQPFQPTNPYDDKACLCNIYLKNDMYMMTEEGEYFEEKMIVEFKYEPNNEEGWRWSPLRVRYDKTAELRNGGNNFGNAYHVANNNWHSIHHPITEEMISTGKNIPDANISSDNYYNRTSRESYTTSLRNFHNLYVKKRLITGVAKRGDTLIDYAVGKAGDLSKWVGANLSFVFGLDVNKDNIHNHKDGACARYLDERKKHKKIHDALFVVGNSSHNIRNSNAFSTEKDRIISKAVFGSGTKDPNVLGKGVYRQYGIAQNGFNISSCQFALHYFFENKNTFHNFMRNLVECTAINGYFIGTCYDGETVFNLLKNKKKNDSITITSNDHKIFEITKAYDETGFPDDEISLGYAINVYQETINKEFREYLVNFQYLSRIMEDYGFILVSKSDAQNMGLPDGTGMFSELFTFMENEIKQTPAEKINYGKAIYMTPEEKQISFMNRYFIFRKVRSVNADKMFKIISNQDEITNEIEEKVMKELEKDIAKEKPKPNVRKTKKTKMVLNKFTPVEDTPPPSLENKTNTESDIPVIVTEIKATGKPMKLKPKK